MDWGPPVRGPGGCRCKVMAPDRYLCPEFEAFVQDDFDADGGRFPNRPDQRRFVMITAEECRRLFGPESSRQWETAAVARGMPSQGNLSDSVALDGDRSSNDIHERLKSLLYAAKEPTLAGLLLEAIKVRVTALNDFLASVAHDERRRKLAFRDRMRT